MMSHTCRCHHRINCFWATCPFHLVERNWQYCLTSLDGAEAEDLFWRNQNPVFFLSCHPIGMDLKYIDYCVTDWLPINQVVYWHHDSTEPNNLIFWWSSSVLYTSEPASAISSSWRLGTSVLTTIKHYNGSCHIERLQGFIVYWWWMSSIYFSLSSCSGGRIIIWTNWPGGGLCVRKPLRAFAFQSLSQQHLWSPEPW